jgi:hypothetical protein
LDGPWGVTLSCLYQKALPFIQDGHSNYKKKFSLDVDYYFVDKLLWHQIWIAAVWLWVLWHMLQVFLYKFELQLYDWVLWHMLQVFLYKFEWQLYDYQYFDICYRYFCTNLNGSCMTISTLTYVTGFSVQILVQLIILIYKLSLFKKKFSHISVFSRKTREPKLGWDGPLIFLFQAIPFIQDGHCY